MALYFFLFHISHIMTFMVSGSACSSMAKSSRSQYAFIFYSVVMNYYYPTSLEELRKGIERTIDRGATTFKVGELMDKHGSDDWLGPLMDELGPFIQVQVADLANLVEAAYNFYYFRSPPATITSLSLFGALFLLSAFSDARFALKVFWFIAGLIFFGCWPISFLHPRYRLLVSPFKWALWDVPTHTEWCFQYLQERAAHATETILAHHSDDDTYVGTGKDSSHDDTGSDSGDSFHSAQSDLNAEERDILSFGCTYLHMPGRFIISTYGIRFVSSLGHVLPYDSFHKPFLTLIEMSKRQTRSSILSPLAKVTTGMDKLELRFRPEGGWAGVHGTAKVDGPQVVLLENMRERDRAFNAVIAFSGVRWQHLQQSPGLKKKVVPS